MAKIVEEDKRMNRAAVMVEETPKDELDGNSWLKETEKVEFINTENPGLSMKFVYGSTKNPQRYILFHGGVYDLPKKVIKHIESCGTPRYQWTPDGTGNMGKRYEGFNPRFTLRRV